MPMFMAPWSFCRRSGKTVFSDLSMAVCWDFWSEIDSIWSIFVVLRLCCPVVATVTRKGNIRKYIQWWSVLLGLRPSICSHQQLMLYPMILLLFPISVFGDIWRVLVDKSIKNHHCLIGNQPSIHGLWMLQSLVNLRHPTISPWGRRWARSPRSHRSPSGCGDVCLQTRQVGIPREDFGRFGDFSGRFP